MGKSRLEAFSDGVIAIIITIMVLELKVPHGADWAALQPLWPVFLSYVLSFIYVGIYWNKLQCGNYPHPPSEILLVKVPFPWCNMSVSITFFRVTSIPACLLTLATEILHD